MPTEYSLNQNYPNPFNPVTKIKYDLPFEGNVSIKIFDISGRLIKTLINENKVAGRYEVDFHGENLSSGVYYYKIESGDFSQVRKMILLK
ncbi:MAG TPA: T9SS type A sorting domain-containing protein [Ignavibacteria bacterium]|nr:T9SS type A sorting domain-containing protein [Ignavibacteria bacterium]HMR42065.1 T9SS type A sorting domain-containing protein [Ignavibacteria bacterium]